MAKPAFDPNKPFEAVSEKPAFDPTKPFTSDEDVPSEPSIADRALESGETFLRSAGDTALLGYSPQINAALAPITEWLAGKNATDEKLRAQGFTIEDNGPGYVARRDAEIQALNALKEKNPVASAAGFLTGAVGGAGGLATKAVTKALPTLAAAAKTSQLAKYALPATIGAAGGVAMNPGDVEGELSPLQLEERLKAAGFGSLAGIGGQYVAEKLPKITAALQKFSKERAVKAIEPMKRDLEALAKMRGGSTERVGQTLLDEGIIGNMPVSKEELLRRVSEAAESSGGRIGTQVEQMASLPGAQEAVSRSDIASRLREKLITPLKGIVGTEDQMTKLDDLITRFEQQGSEKLSLGETEKLKRVYQDLIKYDRKVNAAQPVVEKFQDQLAKALRGEVETAGEKLSTKANQPGLAEAFKAEKQRFGDLKASEDILKKAQLNEQARRFISPSDYGVGAAGAVAQAAAGGGLPGMAAGAALGGVNKLARQYGSQIAAKQSDNLARLLAKSDNLRKAYQQDPSKVLSAFNQMVGKFKQNSPEQRQESKPITSDYVDPSQAAKMFLDNN